MSTMEASATLILACAIWILCALRIQSWKLAQRERARRAGYQAYRLVYAARRMVPHGRGPV